MDRIKELDEIDAEYIVDETDWEYYFYDIIGVTKPINREIEKVELLVSKEQAPYLITKPLHASQRVYKDEDGSVRITIDVIPNYELEKLLLSFGETIEVLNPEDLKTNLYQRLKLASNKYENKPSKEA